jgi:hypothetical protein
MAAPSVPTINPQPLAEDQQLSFDWEGQPSVDNYYIYDTPATLLATVPGSASITTVTGLTNGQTYNAYIVASNANGVSDPAYFRPFQPGLPPTVAPLNVSVTLVNGSNALVEWTPSGESLAAPIQWYAIEAISDDPAASNFRYTTDGLKPETTQIITGLNYYIYQFTVQGVNCPGYSPPGYTSTITLPGGSWRLGSYDIPGNFQTLSQNTSFFAVGTNSFTVEWFIKFSTLNANNLMDLGNVGIQTLILQLTNISLQVISSVFNFSTAITTNTWYHIAVSRDGSSGLTSVWVNGTRQDSLTISTDINNQINTIIENRVSTIGVDGYITNIRFVENQFVYDPNSVSITVPTSQLTAVPGTAALYLANTSGTAFDDSGPNNYTINTGSANGIVWSSETPF